jgi:hypothetical protein
MAGVTEKYSKPEVRTVPYFFKQKELVRARFIAD